MKIIPANPGFEVLSPKFSMSAPSEYRAEPIIAWCVDDSDDPEPITPLAHYHGTITAIRFPDGKIYRGDLAPFCFEGQQAVTEWFAALKEKAISDQQPINLADDEP
jgi:hypothetical protein